MANSASGAYVSQLPTFGGAYSSLNNAVGIGVAFAEGTGFGVAQGASWGINATIDLLGHPFGAQHVNANTLMGSLIANTEGFYTGANTATYAAQFQQDEDAARAAHPMAEAAGELSGKVVAGALGGVIAYAGVRAAVIGGPRIALGAVRAPVNLAAGLMRGVTVNAASLLPLVGRIGVDTAVGKIGFWTGLGVSAYESFEAISNGRNTPLQIAKNGLLVGPYEAAKDVYNYAVHVAHVAGGLGIAAASTLGIAHAATVTSDAASPYVTMAEAALPSSVSGLLGVGGSTPSVPPASTPSAKVTTPTGNSVTPPPIQSGTSWASQTTTLQADFTANRTNAWDKNASGVNASGVLANGKPVQYGFTRQDTGAVNVVETQTDGSGKPQSTSAQLTQTDFGAALIAGTSAEAFHQYLKVHGTPVAAATTSVAPVTPAPTPAPAAVSPPVDQSGKSWASQTSDLAQDFNAHTTGTWNKNASGVLANGKPVQYAFARQDTGGVNVTESQTGDDGKTKSITSQIGINDFAGVLQGATTADVFHTYLTSHLVGAPAPIVAPAPPPATPDTARTPAASPPIPATPPAQPVQPPAASPATTNAAQPPAAAPTSSAGATASTGSQAAAPPPASVQQTPQPTVNASGGQPAQTSPVTAPAQPSAGSSSFPPSPVTGVMIAGGLQVAYSEGQFSVMRDGGVIGGGSQKQYLETLRREGFTREEAKATLGPSVLNVPSADATLIPDAPHGRNYNAAKPPEPPAPTTPPPDKKPEVKESYQQMYSLARPHGGR